MRRISSLILVFCLASTAFFVLPAFLTDQFGLFPLMKLKDVADVFTPLVIIPLYWLLFQLSPEKKFSLREGFLFMIFAALWVEGQGMHLSANSIGGLLQEATEADVYSLTLFYDEVLSHYIWQLGMVGLSTLILIRQWHHPLSVERSWLALDLVAGVIHGFMFFVIVVEASTAPLGIPFAIAITLVGLIWGRNELRKQPLLAFYLASYGVAILFFVAWALYWGGLPQFSEVGII